MKIVVLDGYTLNPGDLNWSQLKALGEVEIYDRSNGPEIVERAKNADAVLTNKTPLTGDALSQMHSLKYIGVIATGYNIVDVQAATKKRIVISNVPGYGSASVAQLVFALLLELCLHVQEHSVAVTSGKWSNSKDFSFWDFPLIELKGKTMGIFGFGDIGKQVADIATAFGMKVVATSRTQTDQSNRKDFRWVNFEELVEFADVISIHAPLTPDTEKKFNADVFGKMKTSALLINTSRGPIIEENDLATALNKNIISGAGLDVLSTEPPPKDNPLFSARNCIITPHIAWATKESRQRLMDAVVSNLKHFIEGHPQNVVNG